MWTAIGISLVISILSIPIIIKICKRYSLYDPVNARKIHTGNIPRLGGVGIIASYIVGLLVYSIALRQMSFPRIFPIFIASLIIFVFGIFDDVYEMKARHKLPAQIIATLIVILNGYEFRQIFDWVLPRWLSIPLSSGWMLGIINAYNLIDGLDGLCGSLSFLTMLVLGILFRTFSDPLAGIFFILAAALFGFLVYNWPPAKIFMGDGGSQFMGFMIASAPLYFSAGALEYNKFLIMLVLVSIPMMDTIAAIWRRLRDHYPIFRPDRAHLHHKLLNIGFTRVQAMILLVAMQMLLCSVVYIISHMEKTISTLFLGIAYAFMIFFFTVVHYTNRAVNRRYKRKEASESTQDDF